MALDKEIKSGKENRKPYRKSKAIDCTCRNHGSCPWCKENRLHKGRDKLKDNPKEWREVTDGERPDTKG